MSQKTEVKKKPYSLNLGPGPGAYGLPTTVGYDNHDNRKQRLPKYSFGVRAGLKDKSLGPGPGHYKVDKLTRYGVSKGNAYSMGARTFLPDKTIGPGPGAHEVHTKPFFKGSNAPAYSMAERHLYQFKNFAPGPNRYMFNVSPIKPGSPKYSIGAKCELKMKQASPGPAAHRLGDIAVNLPRSPAYTMRPRTDFRFKMWGPGPNMYSSLMNYKPGKSGKAYSFGVRHSDFSPPMIVKCDNM